MSTDFFQLLAVTST